MTAACWDVRARVPAAQWLRGQAMWGTAMVPGPAPSARADLPPPSLPGERGCYGLAVPGVGAPGKHGAQVWTFG